MKSQISEELIGTIKKSKGKILALTGAGISEESGIPTFRGKNGLWQKYDPQKYATMSGLLQEFKKDPVRISKYLFDFYDVLIKASPNPAHIALAKMEEDKFLKGVITQNIDNLHQDAGSKKVWEVHGNAFRIRCGNCNSKKSINKKQVNKFISKLSEVKTRYSILKEIVNIFPHCDCGGRFRTDVVLFGEFLSQNVLEEVYRDLQDCSLMLVVGTSAMVYPAAGIPVFAKEAGAKIVEINTEPSALSSICDYSCLGRAGWILPEIVGKIL